MQVLFAVPHFMDDLERAFNGMKSDPTQNCVTILTEVMKARQNQSVESVIKHFKY